MKKILRTNVKKHNKSQKGWKKTKNTKKTQKSPRTQAHVTSDAHVTSGHDVTSVPPTISRRKFQKPISSVDRGFGFPRACRFQAPVQNFMSPVSSIQSIFVICQSRYMLKTGLSFLDSRLEAGVWRSPLLRHQAPPPFHT